MRQKPHFQLIYILLNFTANEINIFASSACWVIFTWCTGNRVTTQNPCAILPTSNNKGRAYDRNIMQTKSYCILFLEYYHYYSILFVQFLQYET